MEVLLFPIFFAGACSSKAIALLIPGTHPELTMLTTMAAPNTAVTRAHISTTLLLTKMTGFTPFTRFYLRV